MAKKKVLIAGASGLVGSAAVRHFAQLPDWEVIGVSRRTLEDVAGATFVSVDLTDERRCANVFGQMTDVTHLIYAAVNEQPGFGGRMERSGANAAQSGDVGKSVCSVRSCG